MKQKGRAVLRGFAKSSSLVLVVWLIPTTNMPRRQSRDMAEVRMHINEETQWTGPSYTPR